MLTAFGAVAVIYGVLAGTWPLGVAEAI